MQQRIFELLNSTKKLGYKETTVKLSFDVLKSITIGAISSFQETEAHQYSQEYSSAIPFFQSFKRAILSYSIKAINGERVDEIPYIVTDEKDGDGDNIRVPTNEFIRGVVETWPQVLIDFLHSKYLELQKEVKKSVESSMTVEDLTQYKITEAERSAELAGYQNVAEAVNEYQNMEEAGVSEGEEKAKKEDFPPQEIFHEEPDVGPPQVNVGGGPTGQEEILIPKQPVQQPVPPKKPIEGLESSYKYDVQPPKGSRIVSRVPGGDVK